METYNPVTLEDALVLRECYGPIPLAGGTDLMVQHRRSSGLTPHFGKAVLLLGGIEELKSVDVHNGELSVGSCVTLARILSFDACPPVLRQAIILLASPGIRNLATLGGNICNASPAGDTLPVLYALDARLEISSIEKRYQLAIDDFILGPGKTRLSKGELVTRVIIPESNFSTTLYRKVGTRRANALSKAAFIGLGDVENGSIRDFRIAFGAVAPTVVRDRKFERRFLGGPVGALSRHLKEITRHYTGLIRPIDDQRSDKVYRKTVCLRLLSRFIRTLAEGEENG